MTAFSQLIGNSSVKERLTHFLSSKYIPSALLFKGVKGVGKGVFARQFAESIVGATKEDLFSDQKKGHPDILEIYPEGKTGMHSQAALNALCEEVYLLPYQGKKRVFIIHDAEKMLVYGSNSLLKTLEDPAPSSVLILTSSQPWTLLKTIHSRMFSLSFAALQEEEMALFLEKEKLGESKEERKILQKLSKGSLSRALFLGKAGGIAIRNALVELLSERALTLFDLKKKIEALESLLKEAAEKTLLLKDEKKHVDEENLPKKAVEKEVVHFFQETLLSIIKDLYLLKIGEEKFLFHADKKEELQKLSQGVSSFSSLLPASVEKSLEDFHLSLERNTPLANAMETLFLTLNLI